MLESLDEASAPKVRCKTLTEGKYWSETGATYLVPDWKEEDSTVLNTLSVQQRTFWARKVLQGYVCMAGVEFGKINLWEVCWIGSHVLHRDLALNPGPHTSLLKHSAITQRKLYGTEK